MTPAESPPHPFQGTENHHFTKNRKSEAFVHYSLFTWFALSLHLSLEPDLPPWLNPAGT
jgi:hypothetical protein